MSEPITTVIRILVVEDDPSVRSGTVHVLQKAGYACAIAANGVEALQLLPSFRPHLVLTDRDMPEMDGIELCQHLKAGSEFAELFVVIISGRHTLSEEQSAGLEAGADGYIARPITNQELVARVAAFARILRLNHALREETVARKQGAMALQRANDELERKVAERTAALRASEENFRAMFEAASVGVAQAEVAAGKLLRANPKMCAITGYSEAELQQMRIAELTHPEDRQLDWELFQRVIGGEQPAYQLEKRYLRKDGRIAWVNVNMTVLRDATGQPMRTMATIEDITKRKQGEAALRHSEARYRSLVETSFDWVWEIDVQGRYTYASPRVRELLGYSPEEVVGRTPFDFMPEAEAQRVGKLFETTAAARQPIRALENLNRHKDGRLVVLETNGLPVFAPDGGWLGYRGMDRDITARRVAENALLLRSAALEAAANAIVITDRLGVIEWANPAFVTLSGWSLAEAVGKNAHDLVKSGKHDAVFYRQVREAILAGKVWQGEVINRRKDGELRTENLTITPVRDDQGTISHFIEIKQDITAQKAIEEHMFQTQRIEAIGTLASGVAHDLNNILSPILLVAGILKDTQREEGDREMVAMVQASAARGSEIVKQLLTFSRGRKGERIPVQLRHLIKEVAMVVRETFPREIELHQNLGNDLWTITADPTQLHQVLLNLCVNARDAMPKGGRLTIGAANVTLEQGAPALALGAPPGSYLAVEVCDTGHGIPPEIRHRIFDPFFTTKPLGAGTGLGLSTVLGVVQSHGGFVMVTSVPDKGTTFTVYLPATAEGALPSPLETAVPPESAAPAPSEQTILVVDDEPNIIRASRILLERHGYRVITAVNGQDALIQYIQNRAQVHLVLSDLMMPVMNGIDLVRALRALDPRLRIIVTSGLSDVVPTAALAELGLGDVLVKPCEPSLLIATVHHQLAPS